MIAYQAILLFGMIVIDQLGSYYYLNLPVLVLAIALIILNQKIYCKNFLKKLFQILIGTTTLWLSLCISDDLFVNFSVLNLLIFIANCIGYYNFKTIGHVFTLVVVHYKYKTELSILIIPIILMLIFLMKISHAPIFTDNTSSNFVFFYTLLAAVYTNKTTGQKDYLGVVLMTYHLFPSLENYVKFSELPNGTKTYFILSGIIIISEISIGIRSHSIALFAMGIHLLSDCSTILITAVAKEISKWQTSKRLSFGYYRLESILVLSYSIFAFFTSFYLFIIAIKRIINPPKVSSKGLIIVSFIGLIGNLLEVIFINEHSIFHISVDVFGTVCTIISSILCQLYNICVLDPICSFLIIFTIEQSTVSTFYLSVKNLIADIPRISEPSVQSEIDFDT